MKYNSDGTVKKHDTVSAIMEYESGEMSEEDIIEFFQELIDSGLCWQLQGHYGRTAQALIDGGYCHGAN